MNGENHRHIGPGRKLVDGGGDMIHAFAKILAPVTGDANNPLACKPRFHLCQPCRQRGPARDFRSHPVQRINHRIAGDVNRGGIDIFRPQCRRRRCSGGEVLPGDRADHLAIHLFRPGVVDIAAAQPRLDMAHRNLAVIGCQRPAHRGRRVALHHHPVRPFFIHHPAKPGQQAGGQPVQRLVRLHDVEIMVRNDPRDVQHLVQHGAMLPRNTDARNEARIAAQRMDQRKQLDRFGTGSEDGEDFQGHGGRFSAKWLKAHWRYSPAYSAGS